MRTITLNDFVKNEENRISLVFHYNEELIVLARRIGAIWNPLKKYWHVKKNQKNVNRIYSVYSSITEIKDNLSNNIKDKEDSEYTNTERSIYINN